jgi:DNA-binding SARP family transcriptional activator/tetratricopeptide (TPR) repeat protein
MRSMIKDSGRKPIGRLRLLGGFELRDAAGDTVPLSSKKAQALLVYLAMRPGQRQSRDKLASLLWSEFEPGKARNSVRQAFFVLRRALGPSGMPALRFEHDLVWLVPGALKVDVAAFEQHAARRTPASLRRAAELYQGDALEGLELPGGADLFEDWLAGERSRLREQVMGSLRRLLDQTSAGAANPAAVQSAMRLVALDPLQEEGHRALMRLYAAQGRRWAALEQYQVCVGILQRELGAEPGDETRRLYQELLAHSGKAPTATAWRIGGTAIGHSAQPPFVGRAAELATLERALDEAGRRRGRAVVVLGEAGVGKTRLLEESTAGAVARGARLFVGRCHQNARSQPFGPWLAAIRDGGLLQEVGVRRSLAPASRMELARLFPELGEAASGNPDDVRKLFGAVAELLALAAARQRVVVLLEDLHWADDVSLRFLAFVGERPRRRLLLLASAREEEILDGSIVRSVLDELRYKGCLLRLDLTPLSRSETAGLVRILTSSARIPAAFERIVERVWSLSEGNPFVIVEALTSLGRVVLESHLPVPLPGRVHELVEARLARLGAESRALLGVAALVGREFDFALVQRASGLDERQTAACLEELVRRRVLRSIGEQLLFVHERVRDVAIAGVTDVRRPGIHRSVAQALESLHADRLHEVYVNLAYHYARGNEPEKAITYLRLTAEQSFGRYALSEALAVLEEAGQLSAELPAEQGRRRAIEIASQQALVLTHMGRVPDIVGRLTPYEKIVDDLEDPALTGSFHLALGFAYVILGDGKRAYVNLLKAVGQADRAGDLKTAGSARAVLSFWCFWAGRLREGTELAWEAVRILERTGERHWLGRAWFYGSVLCAVRGDLAAARRAQAKAQTIARRTNDQGLLAFTMWGLGLIEAFAGNARSAVTACRRAVALAPDACGAGDAHGFLGYALLTAGEVKEAATLLEQGARESAQTGFKAQEGWFLAWAAEAHVLARDVARGARCADQGLRLTREHGFSLGMGCAQRALGRVAAAAGRLVEAEQHFQDAVGTFASIEAQLELATTRSQLETLRLAALHAPGGPKLRMTEAARRSAR